MTPRIVALVDVVFGAVLAFVAAIGVVNVAGWWSLVPYAGGLFVALIAVLGSPRIDQENPDAR